MAITKPLFILVILGNDFGQSCLLSVFELQSLCIYLGDILCPFKLDKSGSLDHIDLRNQLLHSTECAEISVQMALGMETHKRVL